MKFVSRALELHKIKYMCSLYFNTLIKYAVIHVRYVNKKNNIVTVETTKRPIPFCGKRRKKSRRSSRYLQAIALFCEHYRIRVHSEELIWIVDEHQSHYYTYTVPMQRMKMVFEWTANKPSNRLCSGALTISAAGKFNQTVGHLFGR